MKILFVCTIPPTAGGAGDSAIAFNRILLLSERGHDVSLVSFMAERQDPHAGELGRLVSDIELLPSPASRRRISQLWHCLFPFRGPLLCGWFSLDMQQAVGRMVMKHHHNVVIAESPLAGQFLYRNPFLPAARRVICCHDPRHAADASPLSKERKCSLCNWVQRHCAAKFELGMYCSADRLITMTQQERLGLLQRAPGLNVSVVPYGLDPQQPGERIWSEGQAILLGAESLDRHDLQAIRWFMHNVWPEIANKRPEQELLIAGTGGRIHLTRKDLRHAGGVRLADGTRSFDELLASAKMFVRPVRREAGFQEPVLKAMAHGVPVVTTSIGAESIGAQTGDSIFLADTAHAMAEYVDLLLSDAELRERIAGNARRLVESRFSWSNSVDKLERVLNRVVT